MMTTIAGSHRSVESHLEGPVGASGSFAPESQISSDTTAGPTKPIGDRDAHVADHVAEAPR